MRARDILLVCLCLALVACAATAVKPDMTYTGTYRSYTRIADNWTRVAKIYHYFDTQALVAATYLSVPMRRGYAAEWARAYDLPPAEAATFLQGQLEEAQREVAFIVSFYTPDTKFNRLERPDSGWRFWLVDAAGAKVSAAEVAPVKMREKRDYLLYPLYNDWSRLYRVTFPRVGQDGERLRVDEGEVRLRVTGVAGQADLVWRIPPGAH